MNPLIGTYGPRVERYLGTYFERLLAIKVVWGHDRRELLCLCECGAIHQARVNNLVGRRTRSCGCLTAEANRRLKGNAIKGYHNRKLRRRQLQCSH